jgi:hypothetical protein
MTMNSENYTAGKEEGRAEMGTWEDGTCAHRRVLSSNAKMALDGLREEFMRVHQVREIGHTTSRDGVSD